MAAKKMSRAPGAKARKDEAVPSPTKAGRQEERRDEVVSPKPSGRLGAVRLANGLTVEFYTRLSPAKGDVAVCSSDAFGNKGPLNEVVFSELGVSLDRLPRIPGPSVLVEDSGKRIVVLKAVEEGTQTWSNVARGLRHGLAPLIADHSIETVWLGPVGTGSGLLSIEACMRVCLHTLGTLSGKGRFVVEFSLPEGVTLRTVESLQAPTTIPGADFEAHVASTLERALLRSEGGVITGRSILEAVLDDAQGGASEAYRVFAELLASAPARREPPPARPAAKKGGRVLPFPCSPDLALSFLAQPDYFGAKDGSTRRMWGRELIAHVLLSRDASVEAFAADHGTSAATLRSRWLNFVVQKASASPSSEDWIRWWGDAGFMVSASVRRSGYLPETTGGTDKLDVEREALAFAGLIADANVEPPLSIALLGDWGSGKSFFMRMIRDGVARNSGRDGYCQNAIAIEFNAWHMSDANLWASLVDHIFQELRRQMFPKKEDRSIFTARLAEAHGAVHESQERLVRAEGELDAATATHDEAVAEMGQGLATSAIRKIARQLGLQRPLDNILTLEAIHEEFADEDGKAHRVLSAAMQPTSLLLAGVGVAMSAAVGVFLPTLLPGAEATWASLGSLALTALAVLGRGTALVGNFNAEIAKALESYEAARAKPASEEAARRRAYEEARRGLDAAKRRLHEVEASTSGVDPEARLSDFILERARSNDYRAKQGLISLVRRDFVELAAMMRTLRSYSPASTASDSEAAGDDWKQKGKLIDRVVLYIDDLDRCKPDRVVEVLEALHLLLGLDLFVVVVSVDSRWMLRALEVHMEEMLAVDTLGGHNDLRRSTPQNYLEKIFQIPFAIAPMSPDGFAEYVSFLVRDASLEPTLAQAKGTAAPAPGPDDEPEHGDRDDSGDSDRGVEDEPSGSTSWGRDDPQKDMPRIVVITPEEKASIIALGELIPTPRQAKRLVNVFRLLKSQVPDEELRAFEQTGYVAVVVLLSILLGRPHVARCLFRSIARLSEAAQQGGGALHLFVVGWAADETSCPDANVADRARRLAAALKAKVPTLTLAACAPHVMSVSRYSLLTGQDCHTWQDGALA